MDGTNIKDIKKQKNRYINKASVAEANRMYEPKNCVRERTLKESQCVMKILRDLKLPEIIGIMIRND